MVINTGRKKVGKKAVFYTITALLLMAVFLFSFISITKYKYSTRAFVIDIRVSTINDFVKDVERDIQRAAYITSYRSLLSMTEWTTINQSYIDDIDIRFSELFFNGTYDGKQRNFMTNNTFTIWEQRIKEKASELDINIIFADKKIRVWQDDPWNVKSQLNFTLMISDVKETANFTKKYAVESKVPIEFFEDPTYRIKTNGIIIKPIIIQTNMNFVNGTNKTNLERHVNETKYVAFKDAPSYLKRLQGNLNADDNGIESLVNVEELIINGVTDGKGKKKSIVDYIYFGSLDPVIYKVNDEPAWFRIDNRTGGNITHIDLYQLAGVIS
jgi:hypothetical protein